MGNQEFLKECFLTDIIKYEALKNWSKIKLGLSLKLQYKSVPFDACKNALFACLAGEDGIMYDIGCLTRDDATLIERIIAMGWSDVFDCVVSQVKESDSNDQRIKVAIYINKNPYQTDKKES